MATDVELDVSTYVEIDKRIDGAEHDGIMQRWEFGRHLLEERDAHGGNQLPKGRLTHLVRATKKSERELRYRMQFAELHDTKQKVGKVLPSFKSWHEICRYLDKLNPKPTKERKASVNEALVTFFKFLPRDVAEEVYKNVRGELAGVDRDVFDETWRRIEEGYYKATDFPE